MENGAREAKATVLSAIQARTGETWEDPWRGCSEEPQAYGWETREVSGRRPRGEGVGTKDG